MASRSTSRRCVRPHGCLRRLVRRSVGPRDEIGSGTTTSVENGNSSRPSPPTPRRADLHSDSSPTGERCASSSATSTCKPTTGCSSGPPQTASKRDSDKATGGRTSWLTARAKPWVRTTLLVHRPSLAIIRHSTAAGTLRLQRKGTNAIASYLSANGWVPVASGPAGASDRRSSTSNPRARHNRFAHQEVKVAWDNFRINSGTMSCPEHLVGRRLARLASSTRLRDAHESTSSAACRPSFTATITASTSASATSDSLADLPGNGGTPN